MPHDLSKKLNGPGRPRFRNDDVAYDTQMQFFRPFCEIFWKYGLIQTHAVTLRGLCNYSVRYRGSYTVYANYPTLSELETETMRVLSKPFRIEENRELIEFLADSPDEIALHGLYHTNYSAMPFEAQYEEMETGLELLNKLFPAKRIIFFVPPFNKYNRETEKAANLLGLRVLRAEGVHLEEALHNLNLYPGVWYRYHHHRFYPDTTFDTVRLTLEKLDSALAEGVANYCHGRLPMPSFDYEGDTKLLENLITENSAQQWYLDTAKHRLDRKELGLAMGWIYAHLEYDSKIFEVGCGAGNNLHWLARHGYQHLGGSDIDPKALAVAEGIGEANAWSWNLCKASFLEPAHIPQETDLILAINCLYYLPEFDLESFLWGCAQRISKSGCILLDQIDDSFNNHAYQAVHTSQWRLARDAQTRESEYKHRIGKKTVTEIAARHNLKVITAMPSFQDVPRVVYVLAREDIYITARRPLPPLRIPPEMAQPTMDAIYNSGLFDYDWYRRQYVCGPEIMNPLTHFVYYGAYTGRNPNPDFDIDLYRKEYMQFDDATNPLLHSLMRKGLGKLE